VPAFSGDKTRVEKMKTLVKLVGVLGLLWAALVQMAYAAVPAAVTTELGTIKDDVGTVGAAAFAIFLVIVFFAYIKRASH
jgi:hypothetical protein